MARALQLLSLVLSRARASAPCPRSTFTSTRAKSISKGANVQPWARHGQRAPRRRDEEDSDGDSDLEDVEEKLQAAYNQELKRRKALKFHMIRRQMTPRGAPERKLTWDAMEQIRYLNQEQPEEWSVERLAEGFSVSKDVIFRVLSSKFAPNPERKQKQDAKVMARLQALSSGPQVEQKKLRVTSSTRAALPSGIETRALIPAGQQSLVPQTQHKPAALSVVTKQFSGITKHNTEIQEEEIQQSTEGEVEEEDEDWDGLVFSEEDIEEFITVKAPRVVQLGKDFLDVDGNFLYRI